MDLEEPAEGFPEAVSLTINAIAAALTPQLSILLDWKEKHHKGPRNTHLAQKSLSWFPALTLEFHPRKLTRLAAATHS